MNLRKALVLTVGLVMTMCMAACGKESYRLVKLVEMQGDVTYTREGETTAVYDGMNFENGDGVATGEESNAKLSLDSDKYLHMGSNTVIEMVAEGDETDSETIIHLTQGEISCDIQNSLSENSMYEVRTSNATIGVHGTVFYVKALTDKTIVYCEDGEVEVTAGSASQILKPTEAVIVENGAITVTKMEEITSEVSDDFSPLLVQFAAAAEQARMDLYADIHYETSTKYDLCSPRGEELVGSIYLPEDFELSYSAVWSEEDCAWTEEEAGYQFVYQIGFYSEERGIGAKDYLENLYVSSYIEEGGWMESYINDGSLPDLGTEMQGERIDLAPVAGGHDCFVLNLTYVDDTWEMDRAETYCFREYEKADGTIGYMYMMIKSEYVADWTTEDYQYFAYEIFGM